jgi:hypothetical protein
MDGLKGTRLLEAIQPGQVFFRTDEAVKALGADRRPHGPVQLLRTALL